MDLQKLQYFISVAETKSFTSAAERMFISQPALSRNISELEYELGLKLFIRTKNSVSLTPEGSILLEQARETIDASNNLLFQAQKLSTTKAGMLRIGYSSYWEYGFLSEVLLSFSSKNKFADYIFIREHLGKLAKCIRRDDYDLVFTLGKPAPDKSVIYENVGWMPIAQSALYVVASKNSHLAKKNCLTLKDIENEKQIFCTPDNDSVFASSVMQGYLNEGLEIQYYPCYVNNAFDAMLMVAANKGISLSTKWLSFINNPGVVFIPLMSSIPPLEFGIAYRLDHDTKLINDFLNEIRHMPKERFTEYHI